MYRDSPSLTFHIDCNRCDNQENSCEYGNWRRTVNLGYLVRKRPLYPLRDDGWWTRMTRLHVNISHQRYGDLQCWWPITIGIYLLSHSLLYPTHWDICIGEFHRQEGRRDDEHNDSYHYFLRVENPTIPGGRIHCLSIHCERIDCWRSSSSVLPSKLSQPSPPRAKVNKRIILCKARPRSITGVRSQRTDIWE